MYYNGTKFECSCGNNEFRVEKGTTPPRYWCTCGEMYTEEIVCAISEARGAVAS